jgi:hypothetical protein
MFRRSHPAQMTRSNQAPARLKAFREWYLRPQLFQPLLHDHPSLRRAAILDASEARAIHMEPFDVPGI